MSSNAGVRILEIQRWQPWAAGFESLPLRGRQEVCHLVVHRIELSQEDPSYGDTPAELVRFFREHPTGVRATGGHVPYPIVIDSDGRVTQLLPLGRSSPHAARHNPTSIGVALLGDFRREPPTPSQRRALIDVCRILLADLGGDIAAIVAHDALSGASHDPDKECPGRHLDLQALQQEVPMAPPPAGLFHW